MYNLLLIIFTNRGIFLLTEESNSKKNFATFGLEPSLGQGGN